MSKRAKKERKQERESNHRKRYEIDRSYDEEKAQYLKRRREETGLEICDCGGVVFRFEHEDEKFAICGWCREDFY